MEYKKMAHFLIYKILCPNLFGIFDRTGVLKIK